MGDAHLVVAYVPHDAGIVRTGELPRRLGHGGHGALPRVTHDLALLPTRHEDHEHDEALQGVDDVGQDPAAGENGGA